MVGSQARAVLPVALVFFVACAGTQERRPATAQDGRSPAEAGTTELHTWSALSEPEVAAVKGVPQAKQGDMHALLALAIAASATERDAAGYAAFQQRVDQFIADLQAPMAAAADDWHRGYELHRAMHRVFFKGEQTDLGGYELHQPRVTAIFTQGHYNCLSSSMLFIVLARGFGLPVRAVFVPSHVFVELDAPGGKVIEIETTSSTGFDWVHDARFYSEKAAEWARSRGLPVTTLAGYEQRKIVEPYQMIAKAMREQLPDETAADRTRLNELAALVDTDDADLQLVRLQTYKGHTFDLFSAKDWPSLARHLDSVEPAVSEVGAKSKDAKALELVAWLRSDHAWALLNVGRHEQAVALARGGFEHLDPTWPDAARLAQNYVNVLVQRMSALNKAKDYPALATYCDAVGPTVSGVAAKSTDPKLLEQAAWLHWGQAWALVQTDRGEQALAIMSDGLGHLDPGWPDTATLKENYASVLAHHMWTLYQKKQFRVMVTTFARYPDLCRADTSCLENVGAAFVSLANEPMTAGDWQSARQVLRECNATLPQDAQCNDRLKELESSHRF